MRDIARKVTVAIALPLAASLVLAFVLGLQSWQRLEVTTSVDNLVGFLIDTNRFIHALQEERALTTIALMDVRGFTNVRGFEERTASVRARTDALANQVSARLKGMDRIDHSAETRTALGMASQALELLPEARKAADAAAGTPTLLSLKEYFSIVDLLIASTDALTLIRTAPTLGDQLVVFHRMMVYKDFAARERALGTALLGAQGNAGLHEAYLYNFYAQRALKRELATSAAGSVDRAVYRKLISQPYLAEIETAREQITGALPLAEPASLAATRWFRLATLRLDYLAELLEEEAAQLGENAQKLAREEYTQVALLGSSVVLMLGLLAWASLRIGWHLVWQMEVERRDAQRIQYLGRHDPLTGLPNRYYFEQMSETIRRRMLDEGHMLALHLLNVAGFRDINRVWGSNTGDQVLVQVATRLTSVVPRGGVISRLGGDEFAILQPAVENLAEAERLARTLIEVLEPPAAVEDRRIPLRARIGCTLYPPDAETYDALMRNADLARQEVEVPEGSGYRFYVSAMYERYRARNELAAELREAVQQHQFELLYQPKVDLRTKRSHSAEALLRWRHPRRGLLLPGEFIPEAERAGTIMPIGLWVFSEACRQIRAWTEAGLQAPQVSVNLSAVQLRQADLVETLRRIVRNIGVAPALIELEVTESMVMEDLHTSLRVLHDLRSLGFGLAIDDFGTGYSSLSYLRQLPVTTLKLDKSFLTDLETSNESRAIVDAVIWLAHGLHMRVVAEGVETSPQVEILRERGCDQAQGFLFAPAMSPQALRQWM